MDESTAERIEQRRATTGRVIGQADEILRDAMRRKGGWNEGEIEYWLFPLLHHCVGALSALNERLTNLEDLLLRAQQREETPWARLGSAAYQTNTDRQELEAGIATLNAERVFIRRLMNLEEPVTASDRANIGIQLMRMLDRFVGQQNEFRRSRGEPLIPMRPEEE